MPEGAGTRLGNVATTACSKSGHFVHAPRPPRSQRACSSLGGARPTVDARSHLEPVGRRVACSRAHTRTCAGARVHGAWWTYFSRVVVAVAKAVTVLVAVGGWRLAYDIALCVSAPEVEVVRELQGRDVVLERNCRRGGERDQCVRHAGVHHDQSHAGHGRPRRAERGSLLGTLANAARGTAGCSRDLHLIKRSCPRSRVSAGSASRAERAAVTCDRAQESTASASELLGTRVQIGMASWLSFVETAQDPARSQQRPSESEAEHCLSRDSTCWNERSLPAASCRRQ